MFRSLPKTVGTSSRKTSSPSSSRLPRKPTRLSWLVKRAGKGKDKKACNRVKIDCKTIPCCKMCDTGNCPDGDKCEYSHKKDTIDAAKEKKKKGKGKGKDKKGGTG